MTSEQKPLLTARRLMKILGTFAIIVCLCPTFMVSCSGRDVGVSAMDAAFGMTYRGQVVTEPHLIMAFLIILPILAVIVLFLKNIRDRASSAAASGLMILNVILWIVLAVGVRQAAEENFCTSRTTSWFWLNMISMIVFITMGVMVYTNRLYFDGNLLTPGQTQMAKDKLNSVTKSVSSSVSKIATELSSNDPEIKQEDIAGYCWKCGTPLSRDSKFCVKCGNPVAAEMQTKEAEHNLPLEEPEVAVPVISSEDTKSEKEAENEVQ